MHYLNPCHDVLLSASQFGLGHMTFDFFVDGQKKFENFDEFNTVQCHLENHWHGMITMFRVENL